MSQLWKQVPRGSKQSTAKLQFESKDHLDLAEQALQHKYNVTSKSEEKKKLNPKLTISDIDTDVTNEAMIMNEMRNKNPEIEQLIDNGAEMKIVFFDKKDRYCVVQVSVVMWDAIRKMGDKICIGFQKHNVKDRYHVLQCFHCQEFGHKAGSEFCTKKDDDPTCFYCSGQHSSKDCKNKKNKKTSAIKCSNCCHSKNTNERMSSSTHKASDIICPSYVREKVRVMTRTTGGEASKTCISRRERPSTSLTTEESRCIPINSPVEYWVGVRRGVAPNGRFVRYGKYKIRQTGFETIKCSKFTLTMISEEECSKEGM